MNAQASTITLDQLIALSDEMVALAKAGVPIERGLLALAKDMPGRLGELAESLGQRMKQGETLEKIVAQDHDLFPSAYRAAVTAGVRSGRLAAAMEGISSSAQHVAYLRKLVGSALIYPLLVLTLAYLLTVFALTTNVPILVDMYQDFRLTTPWLLPKLAALGEMISPWTLLPPLAMLLAVFVWWRLSGRALVLAPRGASQVFRWMPSLSRLLRLGRLAALADLLALLIEHDVPLDEAILLAADSCGDELLQRDASLVAEQIRQGQTVEISHRDGTGIPPSLGWLLRGGVPQMQLIAALRRTAGVYRLKAEKVSAWLSLYLPILLSLGLGGTATVVYAAVVLGPWFKFMYELGQPF